ncbi:hydroxymethylglutaryl-CoA lyase [Gordonia neofelifaecis]|uniref:Putative hydroxymethylglutaryl-CoA lyase n=1 Tax=Gordonia neofelifaecis NRRL B-59395 TaxID=644548 RepID=F1YMX0_9ACTN|nr:hydroxymethylglutaryl-CoA lyase [Gordonia neofelifaecis]EGD54055.1 putative hydroxymethylglutaryl-CoA lyase [Gordonia neofelifaecis NRRL B-59395]
MTGRSPTDYSRVDLRDVTLRDGLQLTGKALDVPTRVALARTLLAAGVPELEIGSMARPDLVPPMAGSLEVVAGLTPEELERCWIWVATPRHVAAAAAAGVRNFQYCLSVSDAHNRANIGRTAEDSVAAMPEAIAAAKEIGGRIQLCLATAFTCPFDGPVDPDRVRAIVADPRTADADDVVLADTLGQAHPDQVRDLFASVAARDRRLVFHGHDTWGMGVANSLAAADGGAVLVDGALGGLGGCPFAPGASGNTASEDLLFATRPDYLTPAVLADLVRAGENLLGELGEASRSRTAQGARSKADAFAWVIDGQ